LASAPTRWPTTTSPTEEAKSEHGTPDKGEWQDWAEVAAADLADPTFHALVGPKSTPTREAWAGE
jgi:hypothetical protein